MFQSQLIENHIITVEKFNNEINKLKIMEIYSKHYLTNKYKSLFIKAGLTTVNRIANFLGQAQHESKLKPTSENLNYSVDGLIEGFGRHRISIVDAKKYGRTSKQAANKEMIANLLYGGTFGLKNLGNKVLGDGWKYRGRGIFQITGLANYSALTKYAREVLGLDVDYVKNPDLLLNEADSLIGALWYWNVRKLNTYADTNNILTISKVINLGNAATKSIPKGLDDRILQTKNFIKIFS